MYVDVNAIITVASVISAVVVIFSAIFAVYRWYLKQNKQDVEVDENDPEIFHFDWVITSDASKKYGTLLFMVCAKSVDDKGNEDIHWNSNLCKDLEVQEGLE